MFTPANKATACGMWSTTYIIALIIVFGLIGLCLYLSRNMSEKAIYKTILIISIVALISEFGKMLFVGLTYGIEKVEFIPLYFCSLFMYSGILASFSKVEWLKTTGLSFLGMGGIIGSLAFFVYPSACIPNYPIYHYMCLRTMLYHGSMIYVGVLILMKGYYKPKAKDFINYFVALIIVGLMAYVINITTGSDLMYISKPLNFELSKIVFNFCPSVYPFILLILQIIVPFWCSYGVYKLILLITTKTKEKKYVHN